MEQKDPLRNEEMYRLIADTGGACVQPALFKAFGLAVIKVRHSFITYLCLYFSWYFPALVGLSIFGDVLMFLCTLLDPQALFCFVCEICKIKTSL